MTFAEFYHRGLITGSPIAACGDRSVVILDGRNSADTHAAVARAECLKRGYIGFTLNRGETFTRSRKIRDLELIRS